MIKAILLDLDGTVYSFDTPTFKESALAKEISIKLISLLQTRFAMTQQEAIVAKNEMTGIWGENYSIAMSEKYDVPKDDYFKYVWDIDPSKVLQKNKEVTEIIKLLAKKYTVIICSDAPTIWINKVLSYLNIEHVVHAVESGDADIRKNNGKMFQYLIKKYGFQPDEMVSVGDQENSDILPAKEKGIKTIAVGALTNSADRSIISILDIQKGIESLEGKNET